MIIHFSFKMWTATALLLAIGVSLVSSKAIETSEIRRVKDRIFKGAYDEDNEHIYHVAILKVLPDQTTEHVCGGAIIDSQHVLTAAHCVYGLEKNELVVRSGWDKAPEQPWLERRVFHGVAKIMHLQSYVYSACRHHENDIAIIKVKRQFDLADNKSFKKLNLPVHNNDYENYVATLTGYGVEKISLKVNKTANTVKKVLKYSKELKYIVTSVIPMEQCKELVPVIITGKSLCTKEKNPVGFSCIGDGGGPLVQDGVIIGIRNSHNNECIQAHPELFTRVSSHLEFIRKVLNREHSYDIKYV